MLLVPVNSVRPGSFRDPSCLLYLGDHPFIWVDSFINYQFARIESAGKIEKAVNATLFEARDPVSSDVYAQVRYGIEQSNFVAQRIKTFYQQEP